MTVETTRGFECGDDVNIDEFEDHACTDPRNGPYDLDKWDGWDEEDREERDT
jgi:hypothetical protein